MELFAYTGINPFGVKEKGDINARNIEHAKALLQRKDLKDLKVKKKPKDIVISIPFLESVSIKELVIFSKQFSTMIDAGLPIVQCLDLLGTQNDNPMFRRVILSIKTDVESGMTFADSLKKHPTIFDNLFVNLVAAGEAGGVLDVILNRLSAFIEKNMKIIKKVKGALTYPMVIFAVLVLSTTVMLTWVIPTFKSMFESMGGKLPALTQKVIDMSGYMTRNIFKIVGTFVTVVFVFRKILGTKRGRDTFDRFLLRMPLMGPIVMKAAVARFTRTMATMLSSGVPLLEALDIVARAAGNARITEAVLYVRDRVSEGRNMSEPLMDTHVFPNMVVQMIAVGEATGALDVMLNKIADFYEEEVDDAVNAMTSMIEPIMLVLVAIVLGGMLVAMYLPIFSIADNIKTT